MIFGREPARWIGVIVAIVVAVLRVLVGDDLISQDQADAAANAVSKVADVLLLLAPWITAELIRPNVTPAKEPRLESGTEVYVTAPSTGQVIEKTTV